VTAGGPVRVLHLTTVDLTLRFVLLAQLEALRDAGADAIGVSRPGPWVADLTDRGIRHVALPASTRGMHPIADLRAAAQLWRVLRAERPLVLHTHNPKPGLYGRLVGRLAGVPVVVNTVHGFYATGADAWPKRALVYGLEALAGRFSDAEIMISREDYDLSRRLRLAPRRRVHLLGHGVDLDRFDPERVGGRVRAQVRDELGVAHDAVVIGMVGRLVAEKGYPEFFEALASLDGGGLEALVVGPDDPDKADALTPGDVARARRSGVRFLGMRTDLERLYAAMDLFVLPSHREGLPQAAMEAAAMGLPIVTTDARGCREVVDDGVNGLLVPVGDSAALAVALRALIDDEDLRRRMGEASRRKAMAEFDEGSAVRAVLATYRRVATRKGLGHLLPPGLRGDRPFGEVRRAVHADARALARLHTANITGGFLPRLGERFMTLLYRALIEWDDAVVVVVSDEAGPAAFTAGVTDVGAFYRRFARKHWLRAGLAVAPRLLRPSNLRRGWETLRYGHRDGEVSAELLSMAVAPPARRRGLALEMGRSLLDEMRARGVARVRVVVGEGNEEALAAYRKMGFVAAGSTEVHAGEPSTVLTWQA
jgi:glycosyltransferase involved in cell wall biosynthesis/ribosomal protein S18 acetylase RimI-like enzyme